MEVKTTQKPSFLTVFYPPGRTPPLGGSKSGPKPPKNGGFWALREGGREGVQNDHFPRRYGQGEPGGPILSPPFLGVGEKPDFLILHSRGFLCQKSHFPILERLFHPPFSGPRGPSGGHFWGLRRGFWSHFWPPKPRFWGLRGLPRKNQLRREKMKGI